MKGIRFLLKRIVKVFLTIFFLTLTASAQQRIQGYVEQGGFQYSGGATARVQRSFPGATVTVYNTGTLTLATIYSNAGLSTPKSNPFTADANGFYFFYATDGLKFDIVFSGTGITTPFTLTNVSTSAGAAIPDSSKTVKGLSYLSENPLLANNPISRSTSDDVLLDAKEYGGFAAAVTAICGASDKTIHISTVLTVSSNVVMPGKCGLKFVGIGQLSVNGGFSVSLNTLTQIEGGNRQLFAGAGSVILPSTGYSYKVNPVWWMSGSGTFASQWTGIEKVQIRSRTNYDFPCGFYTWATSPAFAQPGIHLNGNNCAYIVYTGTGAIMDVLSSSISPGSHTYKMHLEGFILQGLSASHGLYVQTVHQSTFSNIRVRNMPGIAFFFRSSNSDTLTNLYSVDPIGSSIIGSSYPDITVVPTTGALFASGAVFPGDAPTNNDMTVIGMRMHYINGRGLDIQSLVSSTFFGGSFERCVQEGIVVSPGNRNLTNSVSFIGSETEVNNGAGGDIYVNANNISFYDLLAFDAVLNIDAGSDGTIVQGGIIDTINVLTNARNTSIDKVGYNYGGSGGISDAGQRTFFGQHIIDKVTGKPYPYTHRNITPTDTIAGSAVQPTFFQRGAITIATGFALSNDAITAASKWKLIFRGTFYDSTNGSAQVQPAPYLELTSESPVLNLGGGVTVTFLQAGGGNRLIQATVAGATTVGFAGSIELIPNSYTTVGTESINVKGAIVAAKFCFVSLSICDFMGSGTPEGVVAASVGSTYRRSNGGANTTFYVKESGSGNTGWVAK